MVPLPFMHVVILLLFFSTFADAAWKAGFARIDITPTTPIMMAGYADRDHPSEGVR